MTLDVSSRRGDDLREARGAVQQTGSICSEEAEKAQQTGGTGTRSGKAGTGRGRQNGTGTAGSARARNRESTQQARDVPPFCALARGAGACAAQCARYAGAGAAERNS